VLGICSIPLFIDHELDFCSSDRIDEGRDQLERCQEEPWSYCM
jgi:hypothetical protein